MRRVGRFWKCERECIGAVEGFEVARAYSDGF
jgi:hypothetical protein